MSKDLTRLDVCYAINVHSGRNYLARTMSSIEVAAERTRQHGLRTELLFVLDNSPSATIDWVNAFVSNAFDRIRIVEVSNASLGLSRQDGLRLARAEYIQFCDEDDLISENTTIACHEVCLNGDHKTIAVPEYLFAFGSLSYLAQYSGSADVSPLLFVAQHPFISRIFVHHSIIDHLHYEDVAAGDGYAYEDWLFNCSATANGYRYVIAQETVLFYRQRLAGLLQASSSSSIRLPPPNRLFEPPVYVAICRESFWQLDRGEIPSFDGEKMYRRFSLNPTLSAFVESANRIDPGIVAENLNAAPWLSNTIGDFRTGQAYFVACKKVLYEQFNDVIISGCVVDKTLASLSPAMPEPLAEARSQSLMLLADAASTGATSNCTPSSSITLLLPSLAPGLSDEQMDIVALRLVEASAPSARIHLSASPFSYRFVRKFSKVLTSNRLIYHHSSESARSMTAVEQGEEFNFISEFWDRLAFIVCPDHEIVGRARKLIDRSEPKWITPSGTIL